MILPSPPATLQNTNPELFQWLSLVKGRLEQSQSITNGVPIAAPQSGDMIYKSPLAWARLSKGTTGQILTQGTASPQWGNIASSVAAGTGISVSGTATASISLAPIADARLLANVSGGTAAPSPNSLTSILDYVLSGTAGDLIYRGTSAWSRLATGTSGQSLLSTGTLPAWGDTITIGSSTHDVSSATTQAITGIGFRPKVVFIFANISGTATASFGFDNATTSLCIINDHNQSANTWAPVTNRVIYMKTAAGVGGKAAVSSLDSDGFTLTWTKDGSPTGTATFIYAAIR